MDARYDHTTGEAEISLTADETLVLFDWLWERTQKGDFPFEHQSEQRVIWDLTAVLERNLVAPFEDSYLKQLAEARERVAD